MYNKSTKVNESPTACGAFTSENSSPLSSDVQPSVDSTETILSGLLNSHESEIIPVIAPLSFIRENYTSQSSTPVKSFEKPVTSFSPDIFSDDDHENGNDNEVKSRVNIAEERYVRKEDEKLIERVTEALDGLSPPRSLTVTHFSLEEMLVQIDKNKDLFVTYNCSLGERRSLLLTAQSECVFKPWPQILEERYHGLHHNRSKLSEQLEYLIQNYSTRYIGAETLSTCTVFTRKSPNKPPSQLRWNVKSPGNRLSHLARRRISFSNPAAPFSGSSSNARARQILVDARRPELLSVKSKKESCDGEFGSANIETSRKALFQNCDNRMRFGGNTKENETVLVSERNFGGSVFERRSSSASTGELSADFKKKLQWAVYESLRSQNIGVKHTHFKVFASVLARVIRRFLPNVTAAESGTSDRMLRIARQHISAVVAGKTVDEIVRDVQIGNAKMRKPKGYVGMEDDLKENMGVLHDKGNKITYLEPTEVKESRRFVENVERIKKVIDFGDDSTARGGVQSIFLSRLKCAQKKKMLHLR